jgi:hypothetical protein
VLPVSFDPEAAIRREGVSAAAGAVLAPLVRMYVAEGRFPKNTMIRIDGGEPDRKPNEWFSPSTHPTMDERKLYLYLTQPEQWEPEPWGYEGRMSVTVGTIEHSIIQMALDDLGILQRPTGTCPVCRVPCGLGPGECSEPGVIDYELKRRGHMDGVVLTPSLGMTAMDIKTINHFSAAKIPDGPTSAKALEWLKEKHPYYYGQMQEYLALSGLRLMIMLFVGIGFPWVMKEIHVEYDPAYVLALESKYRRVRKAVEWGSIPEPCCAVRSKEAASCAAKGCTIRTI